MRKYNLLISFCLALTILACTAQMSYTTEKTKKKTFVVTKKVDTLAVNILKTKNK